MQKTRYFSPGQDFCCQSRFCCDFCCEFNFAATFATFLPFVLRAQVLYHVLIKIAESENEDNIMCLLFPASAHFDLNRKKSNLVRDYSISQDSRIFLVLPLMFKFLVAEAVFPEYLAVERRAVQGYLGLCTAM